MEKKLVKICLFQIEEEKLMEKMSSVDTPLGTLQKLQKKTKDLATPYLVLSGR